MPPPVSPVDWEMSLVLPLGVIANQLVKIEGDLRFLTMKAAEHAGLDAVRPTRPIDVRLDLIHESLDAIRAQLHRLQADIHPKAPVAAPPREATTTAPTYKEAPELDD